MYKRQNLVYQTTHAEYEQIQKGCDQLMNESAKKLFKQDSESFVLLNTLSYSWKGPVKIPESFENHHVLDEDGNVIPLQKTKEGVFALVELESLSFTTFKKGESVINNLEIDNKLSLENNLVRYVFDDKGALISAYDKELEKEFMAGIGNVLSLYEDLSLIHI